MSFTLGVLRIGASYSGVQKSASVASAVNARLADQQAEAIVSRPGSGQRAEEFQQLLAKTTAYEQRAAELLTVQGGDSPLASRRVESSNGQAVNGSAVDFAQQRHLAVSVSQTAAGQQTISDRLNTDAAHGLGSGTQTLRLSAQGRDVTVAVDLDAAADNGEVLGALAQAINGLSSSGVSAEVVQQDGESTLRLSSTATGAAAAFSLGDQSGSLAADLGLDTDTVADAEAGSGGTLVAARDAHFSIDAGPAQSSASNTISLFDRQVSLTLGETTAADEPAFLSVGRDGAAVAEAVDRFVSAREDLLSYLGQHPGAISAAHQSELRLAGSALGSSLTSVGVSAGDGGSLSVDRDALAAAVGRGGSIDAIVGLARSAEREKRAILDDASRAVTHPRDAVDGGAVRALQGAFQREQLGQLVDIERKSLIRLSQHGVRVHTRPRGLLLDRRG